MPQKKAKDSTFLPKTASFSRCDSKMTTEAINWSVN